MRCIFRNKGIPVIKVVTCCKSTREKSSSLPGFEPGIFWSVVRRVIHCATSPKLWVLTYSVREYSNLWPSACTLPGRWDATFDETYQLLLWSFLCVEDCSTWPFGYCHGHALLNAKTNFRVCFACTSMQRHLTFSSTAAMIDIPQSEDISTFFLPAFKAQGVSSSKCSLTFQTNGACHRNQISCAWTRWWGAGWRKTQHLNTSPRNIFSSVNHGIHVSASFAWSPQWCPFFSMPKIVEDRGIDPRTSRMLSERSTIWARPPTT